jgi:hypothetical protein
LLTLLQGRFTVYQTVAWGRGRGIERKGRMTVSCGKTGTQAFPCAESWLRVVVHVTPTLLSL